MRKIFSNSITEKFLDELNEFFEGKVSIKLYEPRNLNGDRYGILDVTAGKRTLRISYELGWFEVAGSEETTDTTDDSIQGDEMELEKPEIRAWIYKDPEEVSERPEIRVWCHPHFLNRRGDDYCEVFDSFTDAFRFIAKHPEAERFPMIAFKEKEIDLFGAVGKDDV